MGKIGVHGQEGRRTSGSAMSVRAAGSRLWRDQASSLQVWNGCVLLRGLRGERHGLRGQVARLMADA